MNRTLRQVCLLGYVAALIGLSSDAMAQIEGKAQAEAAQVERAVREFTDAFDRLDFQRFIASFSVDATMFFPFEATPQRFLGREAIGKVMTPLFERLRSTRPDPRYLGLAPIDPDPSVWLVRRRGNVAPLPPRQPRTTDRSAGAQRRGVA